MVGDPTLSTATYFDLENLTTGVMQKFRYLVKNDAGWSGESPIMTTYAGTEPSIMSSASSTISGNDVLISWSAPSSNGGMPIISYDILIKQADGVYSETDLCDGESSTII